MFIPKQHFVNRNRHTGAAPALVLAMAMSIAAGPIARAAQMDLETVTVVSRDISRERVLEGIVEAVNMATVSAQTSGRIAEVNYDVNDYVAADSVILRLSETEQRARVAQAEAEVRAAEARYAEASTAFERAKTLYDKKNISKSDFDAARAYMDTSRARIAGAKAAVEQAEEQLRYTTVTAPFAGIVTERHVEIGESVNPGSPLMTGFSLEQLRVRVDVPQQMIYPVRELMTARVFHPEPGQTPVAAGEITIFPYANKDSNTFTVRIALPAGAEGLYPGMMAKVGFVTGTRRILAVPVESVVYRSEVVGVYVIGENGRIHLRQVRTGQEAEDGMVEVLSGLREGERVALDPVKAGMALKAG